MIRKFCFLTFLGLFPEHALAQQAPEAADVQQKDPWTFGAFLDSYFSSDTRPFEPQTRAYLTQPSRDREPNINLVFVEGAYQGEDARGRLALQAGTSVNTNYAVEPEKFIRHLQEGYVGYQLEKDLWLDVGVFFSHIGVESFISRDNWAYTRNLASDYVPYYSSGARLSHQISDKLSVQLHLLNGWQNISDFSGRPALGTQVSYAPTEAWTLMWNTFVGKEPEGARIYNNFIVKTKLTESIETALFGDVGLQDRSDDGYEPWFTWGTLAQWKLSPSLAVVGRVEQFLDRKQVLIMPENGNSFSAFSTSLGTNVTLHEGIMWRTEARYFSADRAVFQTASPDSAGNSDLFFTTAFTFSL